MTARSENPICIVDGCNEKTHAKSLCSIHYDRMRNHGDPLVPVLFVRGESREARLLRNLDRDAPSGCWEWTASINSDGYGSLHHEGRFYRAHRAAYELWVGPIPDGLTIDHLCRNRGCCNPEHLEAVSNVENVMRGDGACAQHARKTHCKWGHEFTPENTAVNKRGHRNCRACHARAGRERRGRARRLRRAAT